MDYSTEKFDEILTLNYFLTPTLMLITSIWHYSPTQSKIII